MSKKSFRITGSFKSRISFEEFGGLTLIGVVGTRRDTNWDHQVDIPDEAIAQLTYEAGGQVIERKGEYVFAFDVLETTADLAEADSWVAQLAGPGGQVQDLGKVEIRVTPLEEIAT